jgi:hypothetical protein
VSFTLVGHEAEFSTGGDIARAAGQDH